MYKTWDTNLEDLLHESKVQEDKGAEVTKVKINNDLKSANRVEDRTCTLLCFVRCLGLLKQAIQPTQHTKITD
jgi:hypothetical protein